MNGEPRIEATMLLCDSAQSIAGKLFILGGGWSILKKTEQPITMALAVRLAIPWSQANEKHVIAAELVTSDGQTVVHEGNEVRTSGEIEVGRPPGVKQGTPLDAAFVLTLQGLSLEPGSYVWMLRAGEAVLARCPFQVVA